jgi:predicted Zn finger-like uncharacterized protein
MKFLCDRCKTRYSIGDDRVRGKILKIRCKNCANVITVREGMDAGDEGSRAGRPTTAAPPITDTRPANGALNAAFSAQLAKPPPALEEEWYVSIDGEQQGPYSLVEAQRWVASKAFDADLHCWSEGFDDWLPVDKVSHFRGLRKKPAPPAAPPPMPRAPAPRVPAPAARVPVEETTPKPLFAATMASLEKSASTTLPPINATATPAAPSSVSAPSAKSNGAPAIPAAAMRAPTAAKSPALPSVTPKPIPQLGKTPTTGKGTGPVRSAGAQALAEAFDTSDPATSIDSPVFNDEIATTAEPLASATKRTFDRLEQVAEPPKPSLEAPKKLGLEALAAEHKGGDLVDDDNLDIGEVSRVVNLKDLVRPPAATSKKTGAVNRVTGPVNRVTASVARLAPEEIGLPADPNAPASELGAGESIVVPTQVAKAHRRGLIMLIGAAALLLVGVIGAVVFMMSSSDNDGPMGLGRTTMLNTDRPEDQFGHPKTPGDTQGSSAGPAKPHITTPRWIPTAPPHTQEEPTDPNLKKLGADEIEDMAAKQGEGTKFCYIRAQKGALGLEMLDLKKISVTLTVDKTGTVTDVQLSDHAKDTFGACLIARIKGWKFRVSPGGTFRIALAFANG